MRAAPGDVAAYTMRANALCGNCGAWEVGPRSSAELMEAATHYERAAALHPAPAMKAELTSCADRCRIKAGTSPRFFVSLLCSAPPVSKAELVSKLIIRELDRAGPSTR